MNYQTRNEQIKTNSRGLPANVDAEVAVLGGILIEPDRLIEIKFDLRPDDFYIERNATIYRSMLEIDERGELIDEILLAEDLRRVNKLEAVGGLPYLSELISGCITSTYTTHHAKLVRELAERRRLVYAASEIAGIATDDGEAKTERASAALLGASRVKRAQIKTSEDLIADLVIETRLVQDEPRMMQGISCGYPDLDKALSGLQIGLHIIMARPSMGKTSLALGMFRKMAHAGKRPAFISLEMTEKQLVMRLASYESGFAQNEIGTGYISGRKWNPLESQKLEAAYRTLESDKFYIAYAGGASSLSIRAMVDEMIARYSIGAVFVDYVQLLNERKSERRDIELGTAARNLKTLADDRGLPIVLLSQMNRAVDGRQNRVPTLSDLRDSGGIEEAADTALALYRQDYYDAQDLDKIRSGWTPNNEMQIFILKDRLNGSAGEMVDLVRVAHSGAVESAAK